MKCQSGMSGFMPPKGLDLNKKKSESVSRNALCNYHKKNISLSTRLLPEWPVGVLLPYAGLAPLYILRLV